MPSELENPLRLLAEATYAALSAVLMRTPDPELAELLERLGTLLTASRELDALYALLKHIHILTYPDQGTRHTHETGAPRS